VALYVRADEPDLAARLDAWLLAQEQSGALGVLQPGRRGQRNGAPLRLIRRAFDWMAHAL
jgi:cyclohexadienyl dehydratase